MTKLLYGERRRNLKPSARIRPETAAKLLAVQARLAVIPDRANIDATGTRRRLQALMAAGWPQRQIAAHSGIDWHCIHEAVRAATVSAATARAVCRVHAELLTTTPEALNVHQRYIDQARRIAEREHWAPTAAWDNLDDPDALPDWTGYCGTDRGWWTHRIAQQTACPRCQEAHDEWRAANALLSRAERARVMGKARAQAAGREAAIAEDGRELFAQGYDRHQVAARLGITLSHLDHSMARHPEKAGADADQVAA